MAACGTGTGSAPAAPKRSTSSICSSRRPRRSWHCDALVCTSRSARRQIIIGSRAGGEVDFGHRSMVLSCRPRHSCRASTVRVSIRCRARTDFLDLAALLLAAVRRAADLHVRVAKMKPEQISSAAMASRRFSVRRERLRGGASSQAKAWWWSGRRARVTGVAAPAERSAGCKDGLADGMSSTLS